MSKGFCVLSLLLLCRVAWSEPNPSPVESNEVDVDQPSESDDAEPDPETSSATIPRAPLDEDVAPPRRSGQPNVATLRTALVSVKNWPELKVMHKLKTVSKIAGKKFKTKVPQTYRRACKKTLFVEVSFPKRLEQSVVQKCTSTAVTASVALALEGGPSAGLKAFTPALTLCVSTTTSAELARQVRATVDTDKKCGKWKKI